MKNSPSKIALEITQKIRNLSDEIVVKLIDDAIKNAAGAAYHRGFSAGVWACGEAEKAEREENNE